MKWTGHSDYKAMLPYIAIADKIRKENMTLFNKIEPNDKKQDTKNSSANG